LPQAVGLSPKVLIAGAIAAFVVLAALVNLARALNPTPGTDEFNLYAGFPTVRLANILGNGINLALAVAMLLALRRRRAASVRTLRNAAIAMLAVSFGWLMWVLAGTMGGASWALLTPLDQNRLITGVITVGAFSLMLPAVIYALFRRPA
jgi:hypothetical protein